MSIEDTSDNLRLSILGMRCAGCMSAVEGSLADRFL
ncbi:MAG: heavy metal-associated domain-containing protein [Methylococcaceae bacterium]